MTRTDAPIASSRRKRGALRASLLSLALLAALDTALAQKPKIAVFSGPTATIQNNAPLVTSNKAREQYGLPLLKDDSGDVLTDWPRYQRLAAPVTVYVEMFTAHPLEADVKELYAPPDGYVNAKGVFSKESTSPHDKPVYAVTLKPEDGLYALPYMGRQASGQPWESTATRPGAPFAEARQTFVPDASRIFEEIERNGGGVYALADYDFYRAVPAGGYTKGLPAARRTDVGEGDIPPEQLGKDFFAYGPYAASQPRTMLARGVNVVQKAMASGQYAGGLWLEGSPSVEQSSYWMSLLVDTPLPLAFNSAHRHRGVISADGDGNIVNSVDYILSKIWAGDDGKNRLGSVMVQDEVIYSGREVVKGDAHPGGYVPTGGYGGIFGVMTQGPYVTNVPTRKHTWRSDVRVTVLPAKVDGVLRDRGAFRTVPVTIKNPAGELLGSAIPKVVMVKGDVWYDDDATTTLRTTDAGITGPIDALVTKYPLAGIVAEGLSPYASLSAEQERSLELAAASGLPVVKVARGDAHALVRVNPNNLTIDGNNLIASKARLLLTAALMKYGSLPPAADPLNPTEAEKDAIRKKVALYQEIFNTH
jgi:L-asparaginase